MLPHFAVDLTRSPRTISIFRAASRQFLLLCLLSSTSAFAQYRFDHWTTDNGLPQNSVRDILQTRDGYLWLTTFDGLVRFDGVRFTVFNKTNSPGIASNRFVNLFEDRFGDLWATLETGGVVRRRQGRFMTMTQAQGVPVVNSPFLDVDDDGQGNAVVYYLQLDLDQQGKVFTRFALRAYRWSEGRFQPAEELNITLSSPPLLVEDAFRWKIVNLADGDYWTFTNQRVIHLRKGGGVQVYSERNGLPGTQPGLIWGKQSPLLAVTRDASDHLWLTDLKSMHSQLLSQQTPDGFVTYAGYADREGNYWFSTYNNGLFRARPRAVTPYGKAQGLNFSEIYPLHESRDGSLWIGAYGEGVFNLKDGSFKQYPALKTKGLDSFSGLVNSLYEDRAGELWVNGVWRLVDGRYLREFWTKALLYPRNVTVWTMCEDRAGAYWLGADLGVFRYQNGTLTQFTSKDGLAGDDTKVIIEDGTGGLWLGSYGGLTHYKDGKFTVWTEKDGLPGNTVRALKQDGDGALWIGTYDSGLGRFKDGRFTRYTTKDGLFDNGVFQILEDDYGWFWLSCNRGIYRVRKQELNDFAEGRIKVITCPAYNKSDGMPNAECNGGRWPAGVKTRDGKLWFPTMGGVAMIDPSSVKANLQPPLVLIEEMQIDNEPAPLDAWESALRNPQSSIRIEPGQDNFEIAYTALSFINAENMRFKYKLEGRDTNWVDAGTRRVAYFSYLSPGNYTFRVIAANSDGIWNTTGAGVRITVVPPFWRTWWFLTLSLAAMAGAVLMWHRRRIVQLEQAGAVQSAFSRQLMQSQEGERKRIAAELHDSLGQSLAIIKNRALLSLGTPDDHDRALEQLREISEASAEAIDEVKEIAHNLRPYQLDRLGLAKTIEGMIRKVAETHDLRFTVEIDRIDGLFTPEGEINLFRIVQESVNNIVKHAAAIEASVTIKRNEHHVLVTIRDNGRGFDAAALSAAGSTPGGFGLVGMAERAHVLGGHYEIHSVPGHGTVVTLNIGLKDGEQ